MNPHPSTISQESASESQNIEAGLTPTNDALGIAPTPGITENDEKREIPGRVSKKTGQAAKIKKIKETSLYPLSSSVPQVQIDEQRIPRREGHVSLPGVAADAARDGVVHTPKRRANGEVSLATAPAAGAVSQVTERQLVWIFHRIGLADDLEACVKAEVDPAEVLEWRKDPAFGELVTKSIVDKRGSFGSLTEHLLPLMGRTLYDMLANGDNKYRDKAIGHLGRLQGLFIDTVRHEDPEAMTKLLDKLRELQPVQVIDIEPRP